MKLDKSKGQQASNVDAMNARITTNQICDWIESLKFKNKGMATTINNGVLFEAMKALLIIQSLSEGDLIDFADVAIHENTSFAKGTMDIEEAVRVAVRAVVAHIQENMVYE